MGLASFSLFGGSQALQLASIWVILFCNSCPFYENIPTMQYFIKKIKKKKIAFHVPEHYHNESQRSHNI